MLIERLRLMKPDHCYPSKHILLFYYWIGRVTEDIKVCDNFSQLKVCDKSNTCFNIWKFLTIKFCFFENVIKQQYTFTSLVHFNVMWLCGSYTYVEECPALSMGNQQYVLSYQKLMKSQCALPANISCIDPNALELNFFLELVAPMLPPRSIRCTGRSLYVPI